MVFPKIPEAVIKHLPELLTGANTVGVVVTAVLSGKAAVKANAVIREQPGDKKLTLKEKAKLTWKYYVLPSAVGAVTIASGIASNRVSARRIAEATAIAALYADRVKALEKKIEEKYGEKDLKEIKSDLKERDFGANISNDKRMLCYEPVSKQYFKASQQELLMAELVANKVFQDNEEISMNKFLSFLPGCKPYPGGDKEGWWLSDEDGDEDGEADFSWSFYSRGHGPAAPWVDIQPQIGQKNGRPVLYIAYGMWPMSKDDWMNGDTDCLLRMKAGKENT